MKNQSSSLRTKELDSILEAINEQTLYPADELRTFFWDMFIADAFLGNFDRHNGNWGLLVNEAEQSVEIAPVYDCGSCLYPQLDLPHMAEVLNSQEEIDHITRRNHDTLTRLQPPFQPHPERTDIAYLLQSLPSFLLLIPFQ